jgi:5-carboxymethyl-2-hydroxymuconate isomerase
LPHFTIEYSANLDGVVNMAELCSVVSATVLETGLFEVGAIRVRAFAAKAYAIADQLPENSFIDMSFRIGKGRTEDEKQRTGAAIFAAVIAHLGALCDSRHFALSLEIREIDPVLSWKKNGMHARLRGQ